MTEMTKSSSLVELEESTDEGKREMSAARAEVRVSNLLRKAFRLTRKSQRQLAEKLGVTEGRVSQVLNSDGNLRITTIARYLRVMGYELQLEAVPAEEGVPDLRVVRRSRRNARAVHVYGNANPVGGEQNTLVFTDSPQVRNLNLESMNYLGRFQQSGATSGSTFRDVQRHGISGPTRYELA